MSSRQHTPLILVKDGTQARPLSPVPIRANQSSSGYGEKWVRDLFFVHPIALPIQEIDPSFGPLVPICTELDTRVAGFADALFLNHLGMPTLIECKLWRNAEARREVIGQVLDYARVLKRWTFSDLQREAARARKEQGFDLFAHMRDHGHPDLDQSAFVDNVTRNLVRGRALLLVLGDGIREGVEAIGEYIQGTSGLHFTFGLVEAQVFELGDNQRIVQPRVLARSLIINRTVIDLNNDALSIVEDGDTAEAEEPKSRVLSDRESWLKEFWMELLSTLRLDDSDQPPAKVSADTNIYFSLPIRSMWLSAYFSKSKGVIGVYLGMAKTSPVAMEVGQRLEADRTSIDAEIGLAVDWSQNVDGKVEVLAKKAFADVFDPSVREEELAWFRVAINAFINALRPRIARLAQELSAAVS